MKKNLSWAEHPKYLEDIEKEFPNINTSEVEEEILKQRNKIERQLNYIKTTWQREDVAPSLFDHELESWKYKADYVLEEAFEGPRDVFRHQVKEVLNRLRENKRGFQNMVFDIDRSFARIEEVESTPFQSLIESSVSLWKDEQEILETEFDAATSIQETNTALSKMEILKDKVEILANLGEMINRKDIIEQPDKNTNSEYVYCWFLRSVYNAWQEKPAT